MTLVTCLSPWRSACWLAACFSQLIWCFTPFDFDGCWRPLLPAGFSHDLSESSFSLFFFPLETILQFKERLLSSPFENASLASCPLSFGSLVLPCGLLGFSEKQFYSMACDVRPPVLKTWSFHFFRTSTSAKLLHFSLPCDPSLSVNLRGSQS